MNILYVTSSFYGLDGLLFEGDIEPKGLPPQTKVLKALLERGDVIDLVVVHEHERLAILKMRAPYLKSLRRIELIRRNQSVLTRGMDPFRVRRKVAAMVKSGDYDFLYLHGPVASMSSCVALKNRIACGQRAYGAWWTNEVVIKRNWRFAVRHFSERYMFKSPKSFLLATEDGSRSYLSVKALCGDNPPYEFYEWNNGIEKNPTFDYEHAQWIAEPFIFEAARISNWKGQRLVIRTLAEMSKLGDKETKAVFAGRIDEPDYYRELLNLAEQLGVADRVMFLGSQPMGVLNVLHRRALAAFFIYDVPGKGNAYLEAMVAGVCPVVAASNDLIAEFAIPDESALVVEDSADAARQIMNLKMNPEKARKIREGAMRASERLLSWDERIAKELALIDRVVAENK